MALIKCPECGKEVSDTAVACPSCGYGIASYMEQIKEQRRYQQKLDSIPMPVHPKKENGWFVLMGFFILGTLLMIQRFISVEPKNSSGITFIIFLFGFCIFSCIFFREHNYKIEMEQYNLAMRDFEAYKRKLILEQEAKEQQIIKCPNCGSANTKRITTVDRVVSTTMVGVASSKIGKQFECKDCGYKW